jgi:short-subunit dehydrogenase
MTQNVLIFGATSGMAEAVARVYAGQGAVLFLVARNAAKLEVVAGDLRARGAAAVHTHMMDALDTQGLTSMADAAWTALRRMDVALVAHGSLPDQTRCQTDVDYAVQEFRINGESTIACLTALATRFEAQGNGVIAVIGSVAGDRGRPSNYLYGAAKSAVAAFASGLRARLSRSGVQVLTIKPGFVDTPMTQGLALPQALVATADKVAADIVRAVEKRKNVLYTPWFWQGIMLIIKHVPEGIFKKMKA